MDVIATIDMAMPDLFSAFLIEGGKTIKKAIAKSKYSPWMLLIIEPNIAPNMAPKNVSSAFQYGLSLIYYLS